MQPEGLDSPIRISELKELISRKFGLRMFYLGVYQRFFACLNKCPGSGKAVELGSGAGFLKQVIPEVITSDVIAYDGLDMIFDGTEMPFTDGGVRFFAMLNVLHHVTDSEVFFKEISRCLSTGGRVLITDQHIGWLSEFIYKNLHHEGFDKDATEWKFLSSGPLSGANGALAWIIFKRDLLKFRELFPKLEVVSYQPHSPIIYWLTGGMKSWTLTPSFFYPLAKMIDRLMLWLSPDSGSFVDIELVKLP